MTYLKKYFFTTVSLTAILIMTTSLALAQSAPIAITNCDELQNMSNDLRGNYVLAPSNGADFIDCSATNPTNSNNATSRWNNGKGFIPIGVQGDVFNDFRGTLDGQGNTIKNLYINDKDYISIGLFSTLRGGVILNLKLTDIEFYGSSRFYSIGGLSGYIDGTTIENVSIQGKLIITNPSSSSAQFGKTIGGVAGSTGASEITKLNNVHANISINSGNPDYDFVGGLVGYAQLGTVISQSSAHVAIEGGNEVGGLVGWNYGAIKTSYSSGAISAGSAQNSELFLGNYLGGLVGTNYGSLEDSYSTVRLKSATLIGGLVGWAGFGLDEYDQSFQHYLSNSYYAGQIEDTQTNPRLKTGGIVGHSDALVNATALNSFWDITIIQGTVASDEFSRSTSIMKSRNLYVAAGWDVIDTWDSIDAVKYPHLINVPVPEMVNLLIHKTGDSVAMNSAVVTTTTGINCGNNCAGAYEQGTSITLTVTYPNNVVFGGWGIENCSSNAQCSFSLNQNEVINLNFVNSVQTGGPTNLTASFNSHKGWVKLKWTAPAGELGYRGYEIYRNGVAIGTSSMTNYTDKETENCDTPVIYTVKGIINLRTRNFTAPSNVVELVCHP